MGSREEKIKAIEAIDRDIVGPMLDALPELGPFRMLITSDHATPVSLRTHTPDPVPFALAGSDELAALPDASGAGVKYGERDALAGGVVVEQGHTLIRMVLDA